MLDETNGFSYNGPHGTLLRLICHYIVYMGKCIGILQGGVEETLLVGGAREIWRRNPKYTWYPTPPPHDMAWANSPLADTAWLSHVGTCNTGNGCKSSSWNISVDKLESLEISPVALSYHTCTSLLRKRNDHDNQQWNDVHTLEPSKVPDANPYLQSHEADAISSFTDLEIHDDLNSYDDYIIDWGCWAETVGSINPPDEVLWVIEPQASRVVPELDAMEAPCCGWKDTKSERRLI